MFVRVCVFTPRAYIVVLPQQGMSIRLSLAYTTGATCSHPQNSVFVIVYVHQCFGGTTHNYAVDLSQCSA